jgi:hypothetical protein
MRGKLLRGLGVALIAAPEPFTTPFGVGLLAAYWVISRYQESQRKAYLRHLVREYASVYRPFGYGMGSVPKTSADLPYRKKEPLFRAEENLTPGLRRSAARAPSVSDKRIVHHSFDPRLVSSRFDSGGSRRGFEGYWGRQTKLDIKVVHHDLRIPAFSLS